MLTREHCKWMYDNNNHGSNIYDAYNRPSQAKVNAWRDCYNDMLSHDGFDFRITGANCMKFSCAFLYPDPETSALRIRYHTADNVYDYWY